MCQIKWSHNPGTRLSEGGVTCVLGYLGQYGSLGKLGDLSWDSWKVIQNPQLHNSALNKALLKFLKPSQGQVQTVFFGIFGNLAILEKLYSNTLDYGLGNRRSNWKPSALYFTSSKTILKCQDHLKVKLYLFEKVLGPLGAIWGNWV